ncbi:MAG: hypothetical protein ACKVHO_20560 [Verrucomicrobiia bacterium]
MKANTRVLLSIMMFLQFFIWGAWYVTGPNYLSTIGFGAVDFGNMYSVGPIAGLISPFFVGMIADRFFAAQRVLGVMHILGADDGRRKRPGDDQLGIFWIHAHLLSNPGTDQHGCDAEHG